MDGTMVAPIIAAMNTAIHAMKKISLFDTNWNSDEAIQELVKFIATAPKLEECYIWYQINRPRIVLERKKAENGVSGHVRAIYEGTKKAICQVETTLETDIRIY